MKLVQKHFRWFQKRVFRDRIDSSAAHSSFFLLISFLPFVALILTVMQRIHFSDGMSIIETAIDYFPESVGPFIKGMFPSPLESSGVLPVAIIAALWTSSAGMVTIIKGLEQIYEVKRPRNYVINRLVAMVYVLLLAVVILATAALLVFGSTIYKYLLAHVSPFFATVLMQFKSLAGFVLLWAFFTLEYTFLPRRRIKFVHNLAGAAAAAGVWVLFSFFFSLFVENFSNFSVYGSLATLVILMYWLFFCMNIMFMGAEVSMWLEVSGIQDDLRSAWKRAKRKRARQRAGETAQETEKGKKS